MPRRDKSEALQSQRHKGNLLSGRLFRRLILVRSSIECFVNVWRISDKIMDIYSYLVDRFFHITIGFR